MIEPKCDCALKSFWDMPCPKCLQELLHPKEKLNYKEYTDVFTTGALY